MWCSDTTQSLQPWAKVKLVKGDKSPDCLLDPQLLVKHSAEVLHPISVPVLAVCGLWRVFTDCLMNEQGFTLFMADLCKLTYLLLTTYYSLHVLRPALEHWNMSYDPITVRKTVSTL